MASREMGPMVYPDATVNTVDPVEVINAIKAKMEAESIQKKSAQRPTEEILAVVYPINTGREGNVNGF